MAGTIVIPIDGEMLQLHPLSPRHTSSSSLSHISCSRCSLSRDRRSRSQANDVGNGYETLKLKTETLASPAEKRLRREHIETETTTLNDAGSFYNNVPSTTNGLYAIATYCENITNCRSELHILHMRLHYRTIKLLQNVVHS